MMLDHVKMFQTRDSDVTIVWLHPAGSSMLRETSFAQWLFRWGFTSQVVVPDGNYALDTHGYSRNFYTQIKDDSVDDKTVDLTVEKMRKLLTDLRSGGDRILLAGFSNGGSFAAYCALALPDLVDIAVDFSGYVPMTAWMRALLNGMNDTARDMLRENPVELHIHHGVYDQVNEFWVTELNAQEIESADLEGLSFEFGTYEDGHTIPEYADKLLLKLERRLCETVSGGVPVAAGT